MADFKVIIVKTGATTGKEISDLVESIEWAGRRGSPTRTLTLTLIDDDGYKHARASIAIRQGWHVLFKYDGEELFRGIILRQTQQQSKKVQYKAYDTGIYLSNNRGTFRYKKRKATYIFKDVCSRFGITVGSAATTSYKIPELTKTRTTGWDTIEDALSLEYDSSGVRYYVFSEKGKLYLKKRKENAKQWVLETDTNIPKYKLTKSLEDVTTRLKLVSSEGKVIVSNKKSALEKKIGIFQNIEVPDESLKKAQVKALAKTMLAEECKTEQTLTLSDVVGEADVISGVAVFVQIPHLSINQTWYVDEDTHTFKGNMHTMSLKLNLIPDDDD